MDEAEQAWAANLVSTPPAGVASNSAALQAQNGFEEKICKFMGATR